MKKSKIIIKMFIIILVCNMLSNSSISINEIINSEDSENARIQENTKVETTTVQAPANITIDYQYNKNTNTVLATVTSDIELQPTKISWKLSTDKKQYTYEFNGNTNYITNFVDINGNIIPIEINITEVDETPAIIKIDYQYKPATNSVLATVTSNKELQSTKVSWILSADKKQYTYEFYTNTKYVTNFVDKYGNTIPVEINVTEVNDSPAQIKVNYKYNQDTNTVLATLTSNIELQHTKVSWKLSTDKKQYTCEFTTNTRYVTNFVDIYGNIIPVEIKITEVDYTPAQITINYQYNTNTNTVLATLTSNIELQATKILWNLSEDKKQYTCEFDGNTNYTTTFTDKYGNIIPINIEINQIDETIMKVAYNYKKDTNTVIVTVTSTNEFKPTKASWKLSQDQKQYSFEFTTNTKYTTTFVDKYGKEQQIQIDVKQIKIPTERGTYGISGAKAKGINGGSNLEYLKYGEGSNVMFATFCVHGYEDSWDRDGTVLVNIANDFYNKLVTDSDHNIANKWTIYIFPEVNPDGRRLGYTKDGPGRTTLYSEIGKGMDINRTWQTGSNYVMYTDNRNYNGTAGFQAYEASSLRNFLLSHKSTTGQTVLVDLHGWEDQLIGNKQICNYYKQEYTSCSTKNYERYGTQYLISWARQNLGAKTALVELPKASNQAEVNSMQLSQKYTNATLNMLRGI